ncbi:tRNA adenylyltransferase [Kwoniella heveanensis CBS 569]|uniref:tRNA adenylyltransferase n=1 Tax=Kwoniella heveanensis BCC8398 TaxID=1296120 RepID=A0A1B9GWR4_9TREE|nr:tRNA adenylyltransferase [Kwoniella heveanensis BCC8398]OCF41322.1 tRNA adenylyltransferase [Kwoniella heveanensis CBS 569]
MTPTISLSNVEATFVHLLDDFATKLDPPVECRIAGGWVRDKLLSLPSSDLDIALSIPSGHAFAVQFVDYLKTKDIATGSVGRVAANPEQSKHLETGTTRILGLECDFVGLRSETYADSRIPQVRPGTPLEDASRRDLTINALFYNVHTRQVEDFTERGLSDLKQKIACTPLPPRQTFHDDPLRILRCVRFASRFDLTIDQQVMDAIKEEDVKAAISTKVSKERIGIEVTKMLHNNPFKAMTLIDNLGLHSSVFHCEVDPPRASASASAQILSQLNGRFLVDETLWLATAATPFAGVNIKRKGKDLPAAAIVISEGLKLSTEVKNNVANLFEAVKLIDPNASAGRSEIGVWMQHPSVRPWDRSLTWAVVMAVLPGWKGQWDGEAEAIARLYQNLRQRIVNMGLIEAIDKPLLINGTEMQQLLSIRPSPLFQTIRQALNAWQLDHPESGKEDAEVWLKQMWEGEGREEWEANCQPKGGVKGEKRKR